MQGMSDGPLLTMYTWSYLSSPFTELFSTTSSLDTIQKAIGYQIFMPPDRMILGILFLSCLSACLCLFVCLFVCLLSTLTFAITFEPLEIETS